jgi:hypothetical protein
MLVPTGLPDGRRDMPRELSLPRDNPGGSKHCGSAGKLWTCATARGADRRLAVHSLLPRSGEGAGRRSTPLSSFGRKP